MSRDEAAQRIVSALDFLREEGWAIGVVISHPEVDKGAVTSVGNNELDARVNLFEHWIETYKADRTGEPIELTPGGQSSAKTH